MPTITKPILLDETGQEGVAALRQIAASLGTALQDDTTSKFSGWSSQAIVSRFTTEAEISPNSTFTSIAATPLEIISTVSDAPATQAILINDEVAATYTIPANGTYNWSSGNLTLADGTTTQVKAHLILAPGGSTVVSVSGATSAIIRYRALPSGGTTTLWNLIDGGDAQTT